MDLLLLLSLLNLGKSIRSGRARRCRRGKGQEEGEKGEGQTQGQEVQGASARPNGDTGCCGYRKASAAKRVSPFRPVGTSGLYACANVCARPTAAYVPCQSGTILSLTGLLRDVHPKAQPHQELPCTSCYVCWPSILPSHADFACRSFRRGAQAPVWPFGFAGL